MSNNARVGGILSIISGAFGILWVLGMVLVAMAAKVAFTDGNLYYGGSPYYSTISPEELASAVTVFFAILAIVFAALTALTILGGIFALKRKRWGWALAGSIAGLFLFFPCAIPAVVFVSIGKHEFSLRPTIFPPAPPPPTLPATPGN